MTTEVSTGRRQVLELLGRRLRERSADYERKRQTTAGKSSSLTPRNGLVAALLASTRKQ